MNTKVKAYTVDVFVEILGGADGSMRPPSFTPAYNTSRGGSSAYPYGGVR